MAFSKPISSILSPSSKQRYEMKLKDTLQALTISSNRPGVAHKMSVFTCSSDFACSRKLSPPKIALDSRGIFLTNFLASTAICCVNSRVGAKIRARGNAVACFPGKKGRIMGPSLVILAIIGQRKANVLPLPVSAEAIKSFLAMIMGNAYF